MTDACPANRRTFYHEWDAIDYYYHKALYWFYQRHDRHRALRFCKRLKKLVQKTSSSHEAILGEAAWSLLYEVEGDLSKAIKYRESEIKLIRHLWDISRGTPGESIAFQQYDASDLSDRLDLLAILYHDVGDLDKAISVLRESAQVCKGAGIRFDGKDLLRDYLAEKKRVATEAYPGVRRRSRSSA
jgi:tetratricopeptide (TPR) repeat protein